MSYQSLDTAAGLSQAMKLIQPAMKGMPGRHQYLRRYKMLSQHIAKLIMDIEDGHQYFNPDSKFKKAQKAATEMVVNMKKAA